MAVNPTDVCGLMDQSIPQWKRELIIRRRALGRTLQVGGSSVRLTCPAVVAIVRQPEIVGTNETFSSHKEPRSSTSEDPTYSSVNQNRVDFRPTNTSSAVTVTNMRLLDECSDVNNLVINGIDVKNKQSEVVSSDLCVNYNLIMGEDKSHNLKKKSATSRGKLDQNNCSVHREQKLLMNKVSNESVNGKAANDEECLSDSSEELQYGPGIVNRLKTKYLSMTLREQKRNFRPSIVNLRRATSLENMLDGEGNLNKQIKSVVETNGKADNITINNRNNIIGKPLGLNSHHTMKYLGNRTLETMKRARSMDTLLKSESRTTLRNNFGVDSRQKLSDEFAVGHGKQIASIVNENIIIVENLSLVLPNETSKEEDVLCKDSMKHLVKNVSRSKLNTDKELPPPDLVKQTLKIFETSPKKKVKTPSQTNLTKLGTGTSNSTSQSLSSVSNRPIDKINNISSKPTISPKPVLSPEKLKQNRSRVSSPKKSIGNIKSSSPPISNVCSPTKSNRGFDKLQLEIPESPSKTINSEKAIGVRPTSPKITSPQSISPIVTVISNGEQVSSSSVITNKISSAQIPHSSEENSIVSSRLDGFEDTDSSECSKPVPETALENIRRGGMSVQFSFKNENNQNSHTTKSYLPRPKSPTQALNTSLLKQKLDRTPPTANIAPLSSQSPPHTKQIGIIRPLVSTKLQSSRSSSPALTEQEIEKNLINRVKSIEQPISKVVVAIKALPDNVVLGSVSSDVATNKNLMLPRVCTNSKTRTQGLWDDKLWHQNQNTIVFNFSDRKEVPDYIENDGLILRGNRDRPRPGEGGIILLDGAAEESTTDADDLIISDPPSPCDVTFEGDNIIINGKSNLKKSPKQVKLRIKFNDEATTMFEYPSEASLVDEEVPAPSSASASGSGSGEEKSNQASATPAAPTPTTGIAVPLGGSLGAYTPRQIGAGDWQLGVTPVHHPTTASAGGTSQSKDDEEHLKPAPPESTVVWSEGTASDLLF